MKPERDKTYLADLSEEIAFLNNIKAKIAKEHFRTDPVLQRAVSMSLINLGEAANKLSTEFRDNHSDVAWPQIVGLRNIAAHAYKQLEFDRIWGYLRTIFRY